MSWTVINDVQQLLGASLGKLESPSLRLEKMLFMKKKKDNKEKQIEAVVKCHNTHATFPRIGFADMPDAKRFVMKLGGRLLVNHAGGILENTGLCLHRHFGCPYIPGSAIKGIARHQAWCAWREAGPNSPEEKLAALKLAVTFGYPAGDAIAKDKNTKKMLRPRETHFLDEYLKQEFPELFTAKKPLESFGGTVCFLPAFPVVTGNNRPRLAKDITTCHHSNYYDGKSKQAFDNEQPNVLPFPVVEAGTSFEFALKPNRRAGNLSHDVVSELGEFNPLEYAIECLRAGLEDHGLGAKTAAGYGWFEPDKETEEKIEAKREAALKAEEERRKQEEATRQRRERLAAMSPVERRAEELGAMSDDDFKGLLKNVPDQDETEREAMLKAVLTHKIHIWHKDKKGKKKAAKRADIIRALAEDFGEELP